jgi:environmental stress-induced protein Ves
MIEDARYFPHAQYTSMPWRNGAGITREIARAPAQGASFAWRLSLASLQTSGPFSPYAGYQRCVALVDGRGFILHVAGADSRQLAERGDYALFAGAAEARCELLDGACTDLSLIVHDPGAIDSVARLEVGGERSFAVPPGKLQVLFALCGAIECGATGAFGTTAERALRFELDMHDTLLLHGRGHPWSVAPTAGGAAELLLITFASA